jgi:AraC-like DNA-binding protein
VGATVIPAVVEQAGRAGDGADEPWAKVFSADAMGSPLFGGCLRSNLGPAVLVDLSAPSLRLGDDPRAVADALVFLQAIIEGETIFTFGNGAQTQLRPGHVLIRPASERALMVADAATRIVTLAIPKFIVAPRFVAADAIPLAGAIFQTSMAGRLLYDYLAGLANGVGVQANRYGSILDAAAALLGLCLAERPPTPVSLSALAAARADEIIRYLERNFADATLTPASMAEHLGISVRYAHKLLEQTGRSFRQELISLRLRAARRAFAANTSPRETIADIAISVGFNDLSQFNRHFRQAYAMTPRAARRTDEQPTATPELAASQSRASQSRAGARASRTTASSPPKPPPTSR